MNPPGLIWGLRSSSVSDSVNKITFESPQIYSDPPEGIHLNRLITPDVPGDLSLNFDFWSATKPGIPTRLRANELAEEVDNFFVDSIVSDLPGEVLLGQSGGSGSSIFTELVSTPPGPILLNLTTQSKPGSYELDLVFVPDAPTGPYLEAYSGDLCPGNQFIAIDTSEISPILYKNQTFDTSKIKAFCKSNDESLFYTLRDYCNLEGDCDWMDKPGDHQVLIRIEGACMTGTLPLVIFRIIPDRPHGSNLSVTYVISDIPQTVGIAVESIESDVPGLLGNLNIEAETIIPDAPGKYVFTVDSILSDKPRSFTIQTVGTIPDVPGATDIFYHNILSDIPPTSSLSVPSIASDVVGSVTLSTDSVAPDAPNPSVLAVDSMISEIPGSVTDLILGSGSGSGSGGITPDEPGVSTLQLVSGSGGILPDKPSAITLGLASGSGGNAIPIVADKPSSTTLSVDSVVIDVPGSVVLQLSSGSGSGSGIVSDIPGQATDLELLTAGGSNGITPDPVFNNQPPVLSVLAASSTPPGSATLTKGSIVPDVPGSMFVFIVDIPSATGTIPAITPDAPSAITLTRGAITSDEPSAPTINTGANGQIDPGQITTDLPQVPGTITLTVSSIQSGAPGAPTIETNTNGQISSSEITPNAPGAPVIATDGSGNVTNANGTNVGVIIPDPTPSIDAQEIEELQNGVRVYYTTENVYSYYHRIKYQVLYNSSSLTDGNVSTTLFNPAYDPTSNRWYIVLSYSAITNQNSYSIKLLVTDRTTNEIIVSDTVSKNSSSSKYVALINAIEVSSALVPGQISFARTYAEGIYNKLSGPNRMCDSYNYATQTNDYVVPDWLYGSYGGTLACSDWNPTVFVDTSEVQQVQWVTINSKVKLYRYHKLTPGIATNDGMRHMRECRLLATVQDVERSTNPVVITVRNFKTTVYYRNNDDSLFLPTWNGGTFTDVRIVGEDYDGTIEIGTSVAFPTPIGSGSGSTDFTTSCQQAQQFHGTSQQAVDNATTWCLQNNYNVIAIEPSSQQDTNKPGDWEFDLANGWTDSLLDGMLELTRRGV